MFDTAECSHSAGLEPLGNSNAMAHTTAHIHHVWRQGFALSTLCKRMFNVCSTCSKFGAAECSHSAASEVVSQLEEASTIAAASKAARHFPAG